MKQLLWSIQHIDAYERMLEEGALRADRAFISDKSIFLPAYEWMAEQMKARVSMPPENVSLPVWAWHTWEGKRKRRDLRCSCYGPRGAHMVQLTLLADESDFLLSDFDDFHQVIYGTYIADSEADYDSYYNMPYGEEREKRLARSWEKIFDLSRDFPDYILPNDMRSIQATLWEIRPEQIIKVEHFIAR